MQEGLTKTIDSYSHLRAELYRRRDGPSKASIYLGSGRGIYNHFLLVTYFPTYEFCPAVTYTESMSYILQSHMNFMLSDIGLLLLNWKIS